MLLTPIVASQLFELFDARCCHIAVFSIVTSVCDIPPGRGHTQDSVDSVSDDACLQLALGDVAIIVAFKCRAIRALLGFTKPPRGTVFARPQDHWGHVWRPILNRCLSIDGSPGSAILWHCMYQLRSHKPHVVGRWLFGGKDIQLKFPAS